MSSEVPSLWPAGLEKLSVLTPAAILKRQAAELGRLTKGLLRGEVRLERVEDREVLRLEIVAPMLGYERHGVLVLYYNVGMPYPCQVDNVQCWSDRALMEQLGNRLKSGEVIAVLQSLMARSAEVDPVHGSEQ